MHHQVFSSDILGLNPDEFATLRANLLGQRRFRLAQLRRLETGGPERAEERADAAPADGPRASAVRPGPRARRDAGGGGAVLTDAERGEDVRGKREASIRMMLADVEAALARMDEGRYGTCSRCSAPIARERLAVVPQARYCGPCQRTGRSRR